MFRRDCGYRERSKTRSDGCSPRSDRARNCHHFPPLGGGNHRDDVQHKARSRKRNQQLEIADATWPAIMWAKDDA
jgi:hypothetical protein